MTQDQSLPLILPNISQSLIKDYVDYFDENIGECGRKILYKFFYRISTPRSEAQKLGVYFEYRATGYHDKREPVPQPEKIYKGTSREDISAAYKRVEKAVELFKETIKAHGIKILKVGEYMKYKDVSGITDLRAEWNGKECIIDIKHSGQFDDKFSEFGWHTESLPLKSKQMLQPIHYKWLNGQLYGDNDIPFYYYIQNAQDEEEAKIILVNIDEAHVILHGNTTIPKIRSYVAHHFNNPHLLEARPNYIRCKECAFKDRCDKKAKFPMPEEIYY
jgi:hypothetical protein